MMTPELQILLSQEKVNDSQHYILLERRFLGRRLKVSIEANGRLRGWITAGETREVKLKGLPAYLNFERATQLLKQSYLKLQKEVIEVLPRGLGGMQRAQCADADKKQVLIPSEKDIYSLIEAISDEEAREIVWKDVTRLLEEDLEGGLQVNQPPRRLHLYAKKIGDAGAQALAAILQVNQSFRMLNLGDNQIGAVGTQILANALEKNQFIQWIILFDNQIGDAGVQALSEALKVNQSIQQLDLGWNQISAAGVQFLGEALKVNQSLQTLVLSYNEISDAGAQVLGIALQVNQSLQVLELYETHIGAAGAQALGKALQVNRSLQNLKLDINQIGDAGVQALSEGLRVNQSLQILNLSYNKIGAAGAQALGEALQVNQSLQELELYSNQIGDMGAQALGDALQVNQSIHLLYLGNNQIGDAGAQVLGAALLINQSIQELQLHENQIGDAGAQAMGVALQVNQSLRSLELQKNQIGDAGVQALGAALQVNQSLHALDLDENKISNVGAQILKAVLQVNQSIRTLQFCDNPIDCTTSHEIGTLLQPNRQIASAFRKQVKEVKKFLELHENDEGIPLEHLPQLQTLLQKWHSNVPNIIPSIEEIFRQSRQTDLNDRYREKLAAIIRDLTNRLHELWLEAFEKRVVTLSNEYVMGKESSKERNIDLGHALYDTWQTFLGSGCPKWLEDHLQSLLPFGVLLDIAEGGEKQNVTDLTDIRSLFERVLSFQDSGSFLPVLSQNSQETLEIENPGNFMKTDSIEINSEENPSFLDIDVSRDGACLFHAISLGLELNVNSKFFPKELRDQAAAHIAENSESHSESIKVQIQDLFDQNREFLGKSDDLFHGIPDAFKTKLNRALKAGPDAEKTYIDFEGVNDYIEHMFDLTAWGGEIELGVLAELLKVELLVYNDPSAIQPLHYVGKDGNQQIHLLHTGGHYKLRIPKGDKVSTSSTPQKPLEICVYDAPVHHFIGREIECETIKEKLPPVTMDNTKTKVVVLTGLEGVGKTQVARKFVAENFANYSMVYTFDGQSTETLQHGYKSLISQWLKIDMTKESPTAVRNRVNVLLEEKNKKGWLLLFDNVDNPKLLHSLCIEQLPKQGGCVLITSRSRFDKADISIHAFKRNEGEKCVESVTLLKTMIPLDKQVSEEILDELTKELHDIPLALVQAGTLLKNVSNCSGAFKRALSCMLTSLSPLQSKKPHG